MEQKTLIVHKRITFPTNKSKVTQNMEIKTWSYWYICFRTVLEQIHLHMCPSEQGCLLETL